MKKVLALALALVMALSMGTMAFAAELACGQCDSKGFANDAELKKHMDDVHPTTTAPTVNYNDCPVCGKKFANEAEYNKHLDICDVKGNGKETIRYDLTVNEILNMIIDLIKTSVDLTKASMSQWDAIDSVIVRLVDFVENMGSAVVSEAEVKGAVADLESALAGIEIPGINDLLNQLKQKIKDMYAGEVATTVVEETTAAEEIVETGSSSVGIAVFAAVSVAAAAAYVCTKKSK